MKHRTQAAPPRQPRISKKGLPPGTHIYTGKHFTHAPEIEVFTFNPDKCEVSQPLFTELGQGEDGQVRWININGINHTEAVTTICRLYDVHYLYQEDILNIFQRPKAELEDNYIFLTFKSLEWESTPGHVTEEQISLILAENATISFQEKPGDHFGYLREKLTADLSVIRTRKADYLFYRLLDITVDSYFELLEKMGVILEDLENKILEKPSSALLQEIQRNRKDLMTIRKNIYPMRDLLSKVINSEHPLISDATVKYFRDVQDHTIQIIETLETFREMNLSLKDAYLNAMSHEMNKIMKVLTIISTLFIPLTFIAGVYGMNFKYMPELEWAHGYYFTWGIMVTVVVSLIIWFRRKSWF